MTQGGWSRREALFAGGLGAAALSTVWAAPVLAQSASEGDRVDALVASFMQALDTPGIAVTLVRAGGHAADEGA